MHKDYLSISAPQDSEMLVVQFKTNGAYPFIQQPIHQLNKELKGNTTAEIIQARMLKDEMPTGSNLAGLISINNPELNIKVLPTKDLGNADPIDYMTEIVTTVNADETTPDYPAGVYVLKDKVIQITEEGSVIPVPINALK